MKKSAFIPLVLLLIIFVCFYVVHQTGQKERDQVRIARVAADLKAKNEAELLARKNAMTDAIKAAEVRKLEREAKEAKDTANKEIRQVAIDARDKAFRDQERMLKQPERLKKDIEAEEAVIAKLTAGRKQSESELKFITTLNAKAQDNVKTLQTVLNKINAPAPAPSPTAAK